MVERLEENRVEHRSKVTCPIIQSSCCERVLSLLHDGRPIRLGGLDAPSHRPNNPVLSGAVHRSTEIWD
jgi:hypothetical protein